MPGRDRDERGAAAAVGRSVAEPVRRRAIRWMAAALLAGRQEVLPDIPARIPMSGNDGAGAAAGPQGFRRVCVPARQRTQCSRLALSSAVPTRWTVRWRPILCTRPRQVLHWVSTFHIVYRSDFHAVKTTPETFLKIAFESSHTDTDKTQISPICKCGTKNASLLRVALVCIVRKTKLILNRNLVLENQNRRTFSFH